MKPTLKALVSKRLKLEHDTPPSNFAFNFNLRRHIPFRDSKLTHILKPALGGRARSN